MRILAWSGSALVGLAALLLLGTVAVAYVVWRLL